MMPSVEPLSWRPMRWRLSRAVGGRTIGEATGEVDHEPEPELRDGGGEARRRASDQDPVAACSRHVDVADIDGATHERHEFGGALEEGGETRRLPVGDDNLAALAMPDERLGVEHPSGRVDDDLGHLPQRRDGTLAVIVV
jgi:hypothetical protein